MSDDSEDPEVEWEGLVWACAPFVTIEEFFDCGCDCSLTGEGDDDDLVRRAINSASDRLAVLSGHVLLGECTQTLIICHDECLCSCRRSCTCGLDFIQLPGPILAVESITFEGYETYEATDFRLLDDDKIAFVDGSEYSWPHGDVLITVTFGPEIDQFAKDCAMELACYVVKACLGGAQKAGPNMGSFQRQGVVNQRKQVSFFADLTQMAATDRPWMAEFLAIYNPDRSRVPASMASADQDAIHVVRPMP